MSEEPIFAGPALRRLRKREGLTQAAMAQRLDISPSYLNLIERNQRPLTADMLLRLARTYKMDMADLAGDGGADQTARLQAALDRTRDQLALTGSDRIDQLRAGLAAFLGNAGALQAQLAGIDACLSGAVEMCRTTDHSLGLALGGARDTMSGYDASLQDVAAALALSVSPACEFPRFAERFALSASPRASSHVLPELFPCV